MTDIPSRRSDLTNARSNIFDHLVITVMQDIRLFDTTRSDDVVSEVAARLEQQISLLPKSLRTSVSLALKVFNLESIIFDGKTFKGLSPENKGKHLTRWANSRLSSKRDFIRYIRSITLFNYFDHKEIRSRI